jgi:shikimate kinase
MDKIFLVGFMGVGKSTTGKKLANKIGWHFIDTDAIFEEKYKLDINTFFNKYGEKLFRKLENEVLVSTFNYSNCVISTGGGMPCYEHAMDQINNNGLSIYLSMPANAILGRLTNSKQKRPLVLNKTQNELRSYIRSSLDERIPYYSKAKIIIPAISISVELLVKNIIDKIQIKNSEN